MKTITITFATTLFFSAGFSQVVGSLIQTNKHVQSTASNLMINPTPNTENDTTGNVGIGTTIPSAKLHVVGSVKIKDLVITTKEASNSLVIGTGSGDTLKAGNFYVGYNAGRQVNGGQAGYNVGIGYEALDNATNAGGTIALGYQAGINGTGHQGSVLIGTGAGANSGNAQGVVAVGTGALGGSTNARQAIAVGWDALQGQDSSEWTIALGINAGFVHALPGDFKYRLGKDNILIGSHVTLPYRTSGGLNIGNVIYGFGLQSRHDSDIYFSPMVNGRIGINTNSPDSNFTVNGSVHINKGVRFSGLKSSNNSSDSILIVNASNGVLGYRSIPTNSIGIGITSVSGTNGRLLFQGNTGTAMQTPNLSWDSSTNLLKVGGAYGSPLGFATNDMGLAITRALGLYLSSGTMNAYIAPGDGMAGFSRMVLRDNAVADVIKLDANPSNNSYINAGNLGIGNSNPAYTLDVTGTINVAGTSGNTYRWNAATGAPNNTSTPAGWVRINVNGNDAWLPYYQ